MTLPISRFTPPIAPLRWQAAPAMARATNFVPTPHFGTRKEPFAPDSTEVLGQVTTMLSRLKPEDGSLQIVGGLGRITKNGGIVGEVRIRQENGSYERYLLHRSENGHVYCLAHVPPDQIDTYNQMRSTEKIFGSYFYQSSDIATQSDAILLKNKVPTTLVVSTHGGGARLFYHHPNKPSGQDGRGTTLRAEYGNHERARQLRDLFKQWETWGVFKMEDPTRPTIPGAPEDWL